MSTFAVQPEIASSWKQEVSQRIAAHKSRRGWSPAEPATPAHSRSAASSRAAQAAARVAARYAQAPSYSQMPAASAGPRLWAPEAAPQVVEPAWPSEPDREPVQPAEPHTLPASLPDSLDAWESEQSHTRWETDSTLRPIELDKQNKLDKLDTQSKLDELDKPDELDKLDKPDRLVCANLIQFPRELVATRKMRPRRAERANAVEGQERQLSIFEVDPGTVSVEAGASVWPEPGWSGIRLEAQTQNEAAAQEAPAPLLELELAPIGHRLLAALVDGALIAAALLGAARVAAANIAHPPAARIAVLMAVSAFLLIGMLYQTLFLTLDEATPGMRCAGISLCTFDGQIPTPAELRSRLGALLLSVVPVGLGVAWTLFDDDHLSWHDRLSRTYLRKG